MSEKPENQPKQERNTPFYKMVGDFRIPGIFSVDAYRSALAYKPRPDDLFIVAYPKCGSNWMQNIVACIFKNGRPFESAIEFMNHAPLLDMAGAEAAETMKRPGAIKFHSPYNRTPMSPEAKYIFVARNPKDCCVSFYHHTENIAGYHFKGGSFDDYFELFIEGQVDYGDYFDTVMSWYEHRNDPNVFFITYEELKKDIMTNTLRIAEFIGHKYKEALERDEKMLQDVIHHSSFSFLKDRVNRFMAEFQSLPKELIRNHPDIPPGVRAVFGAEDDVFEREPQQVNFVRKGIVGDWKNYFSAEQNARLEKKYQERMGNTELAQAWKNVM